ncbi:hypothetical protein COHA_005168 [Chlorella ohadii]|uniref:Uncharacterized protein n=1 Tax=Chlorella ohadii TaxID=2649997 RepID=A0AAD5H524_9CHLO|nr:hypothetical protein COHA_005168 [Chlorella ohadii]
MSYQHLPFVHVTQRHLHAIMETTGTVGFELADGSISRRKKDLPEGGAVKLVLPAEHPWAIQQRKLEQARDSAVLAEELGIGAYLQQLASTENAGCPVTMLQTEPFTDAQGEKYEQFVAAVVAGGTLYVAELKRVLDEESVRDAFLKLIRIRRAHRGSGSPDLAAALQGVTQTKMFLVGERVEEGEEGQLLIDMAREGGMSVLLPSGQGLELVVNAPPVQL